jgi:Fe-S oxidoreductase
MTEVDNRGGQFKGKKITFHDPCYLGRLIRFMKLQRFNSKLDAVN